MIGKIEGAWAIRVRGMAQPTEAGMKTQERKADEQNSVGGSSELGNKSSWKVGSKWKELNH